jgi:hypothetical protein
MDAEIWLPLTDLQIATNRESSLSCVVVTPETATFADVDLFAKSRLDLEITAIPSATTTPRSPRSTPHPRHGHRHRGAHRLGGLLGGLNTMYAAFAARVREVGMLQALGFTRLAIVLNLTEESVFAAACGALIGAALGLALLDGLAVRFSMGAFALTLDAPVVLIGVAGGPRRGLRRRDPARHPLPPPPDHRGAQVALTDRPESARSSAMDIFRPLICVPLVAVLAVLAGCGGSGGESPDAAATPGDPAWLLAEMPGSVADVAIAKRIAAEGDEIVLRGVIGGRLDAMSEDAAFFVMMDANLDNPCVTAADDHCATPWDYCCTPSKDKVANSATVQLVDASGAPLRVDLRDFGIEPLDTVVVVGSVAARPSAEVLTVRATRLHRVAG